MPCSYYYASNYYASAVSYSVLCSGASAGSQGQIHGTCKCPCWIKLDCDSNCVYCMCVCVWTADSHGHREYHTCTHTHTHTHTHPYIHTLLTHGVGCTACSNVHKHLVIKPRLSVRLTNQHWITSDANLLPDKVKASSLAEKRAE